MFCSEAVRHWGYSEEYIFHAAPTSFPLAYIVTNSNIDTGTFCGGSRSYNGNGNDAALASYHRVDINYILSSKLVFRITFKWPKGFSIGRLRVRI
jgi:hypothetical protein